ncbi:MAG: hypothetical protein II141_03985, partial [Clostridia bacterium]|nr:hypothetical protein [Clostridia bacterium]
NALKLHFFRSLTASFFLINVQHKRHFKKPGIRYLNLHLFATFSIVFSFSGYYHITNEREKRPQDRQKTTSDRRKP